MNLLKAKTIIVIFILSIYPLFIKTGYADTTMFMKVTETSRNNPSPASNSSPARTSTPAPQPAPQPASQPERTSGGGVVTFLKVTAIPQGAPTGNPTGQRPQGVTLETGPTASLVPFPNTKGLQSDRQPQGLTNLPQVKINELRSGKPPLPEAGATEPRYLKVENQPILAVAFGGLREQENTFGRIAYYTERGRTIVDWEQLQAYYAQGHNPFTAHDFNVQGLANFYNAFARAQVNSSQLRLNTGEVAFLNQLTSLGILRYDGNAYTAGITPFAVISYTGEYANNPEAMKLIIDHELSHAFFYTNPAYRQRVEAIWNNLPELARRDILGYLGKTYDINDRMVLHKEFAAYFRDFNRLVNLGQSIRTLQDSAGWEAIRGAIGQLRGLDSFYETRRPNAMFNPDLEEIYRLNPNLRPN